MGLVGTGGEWGFVLDRGPPGVSLAEGGSEWRAGEEGGTVKGRSPEEGWGRVSAVGFIMGSGARAEWLIFLQWFSYLKLKHQYKLNKLAHFFLR